MEPATENALALTKRLNQPHLKFKTVFWGVRYICSQLCEVDMSALVLIDEFNNGIGVPFELVEGFYVTVLDCRNFVDMPLIRGICISNAQE